MESFFYLLFVVVIIAGLVLLLKFLAAGRSEIFSAKGQAVVPKYQYQRRDCIMTAAEAELFRRLETIAGDRYYIFPQVHLSSLLDHKVKGQNWKGALSAIQRKSVDFALVDKATLETKYAVELDDSTHDKPERQERDSKVEQYLASVGIPLVRLRNQESMVDDDINAEFMKVHTGQTDVPAV